MARAAKTSCDEGSKSAVEFVQVKSEQDIAEAAQLAHDIWNECYNGMLSQGQIDYMVEKFQSEAAIRRQIDEEGYEYYIMAASGVAAGYLAVQASEGKLFLSKLYFLAQNRGKGLLRQAFAFLDGLAQKKGCAVLWLTVHKYNERAVRAYERAGFLRTRDICLDIGGGYVMDDYVFERAVVAAGEGKT